MPLLAFDGQLTSMCKRKSRNFLSVTRFEPAALLTRQRPSTFQLTALPGLSKCQPEKSRPLKRLIGLLHLGWRFLASAGAPLPVHVQRAPFGPLAVPLSVFPRSLPSNIKSVLLPSSSLGETKRISSAVTITLGNDRAFPQRPTNKAFQPLSPGL